MKKLLLCLGLFGFLCMPVIAKDVPYITNFPYKPYTKEIKLNKIDNQTMQNDLVSIEKNKFEFKYVPKMGHAYEYVIVNNTQNDIILKGVNSKEFYNEDLSNDSNKPLKNMTKNILKTGKMWIPLYGNYYAVRCDLEKNSFIRDFPENKTLKVGESIRILASATHEFDNPIAEFVFIVDNEEKSVSF